MVLNQFALPGSEAGGTRHIELFGRLADWAPTIVAGRHNYSTQQAVRTDDDRFRLVWVPTHDGGSGRRVLGWIAYSVQAMVVTLTRRRVDLVYASSPHLLAPLAGLVAAKVRRVPFVLEIRDLWPESIVAAGMLRRGSRMHRVLSRLERILVRSAEAIVTVTPGWELHLIALGAREEAIHVVPNGADPDALATSTPREQLRAERGITGFTAIYSGAHGPANDIPLILDAAERLPDVNVILIGEGSVKKASQEDARRRGLDNVRFLSPVPKDQLARVLAACDVGIHSVAPLGVLNHGMSPNKLYDYMAAGLPVVSNAEEGLRHVATDEECGRLGGPDSLTDGLRAVRDASVDRRAEWGRRGQEIVRQRFSRDAGARRLAAVLDGVSQKGRRRPSEPAIL